MLQQTSATVFHKLLKIIWILTVNVTTDDLGNCLIFAPILDDLSNKLELVFLHDCGKISCYNMHKKRKNVFELGCNLLNQVTYFL